MAPLVWPQCFRLVVVCCLGHMEMPFPACLLLKLSELWQSFADRCAVERLEPSALLAVVKNRVFVSPCRWPRSSHQYTPGLFEFCRGRSVGRALQTHAH